VNEYVRYHGMLWRILKINTDGTARVQCVKSRQIMVAWLRDLVPTGLRIA
jgi:hypothetical protein